jgi:hypothetical protein
MHYAQHKHLKRVPWGYKLPDDTIYVAAMICGGDDM